MNRLAKAGYWMLDYGYSARSEVSALIRARRVGPVLEPGSSASVARGAQVVLVPGVYEQWHFLLPLARRLARRGHTVHLLPELGRNTRPIAESARILAARLAADDLRDVVIVAHSKGGLIAKYVMLRLDPEQRVRRLIAVNSPFSGSAWARYLRIPSVRMFAADDLTVTFLGARSPVNARITSVCGTFDQHVPAGSRLPGARNIELPVAGHSRIVGSRAFATLLDAELAELAR